MQKRMGQSSGAGALHKNPSDRRKSRQGRGGKRPGAGRPAPPYPVVRAWATLPVEHDAYARRVGDGSLSRGLSIIIARDRQEHASG